MKIVMIGTGYVGLVTGLGFAKLGHSVACVDTDETKIARLDLGETPFYEPGLQDLLSEMQGKGAIMFTSRLRDVLADADLIMLAVGTPSGPFGEADLSYLYGAAEQIGEHLNHQAIIVCKSTVPVGTNRKILGMIGKKMQEKGRGDIAAQIQMVSLPEFLREGRALRDFMHPDRLVIGTDTPETAEVIDQLHQGITAPRLVMSIESAELTKYAANAFLATKISFINEIANIAEKSGANVLDIAEAIGLDKRIGPHFLHAGIGYGGSCFPKDVSALHQLAGSKGYEFKLLSSVIEVNNRQRDRFLRKVESVLGDLKGRKIAVWGLAFKAGTDDVRESASIHLIQQLFAKGAEIVAYDPEAMRNAKRELSDHVQFAPTAIDAAQGADALLVLTDWPEFRSVSLGTLRDRMLEPRIFDGRNLLADLRLEDEGFAYYGVGMGRLV